MASKKKGKKRTKYPPAGASLRWPEVRGLLSEAEGDQLNALACEQSESGVIVEIGAYMGLSTLYLASDTDAHVYSIDLWDSSPAEDVRRGGRAYGKQETFLRYIGNTIHLPNVTWVKGDSGQIGKVWRMPIDVLFIDGAHDYESVKRDFELFSPHVREGGAIVFHDAQPGTKVRKLINEIEEQAFHERWYVGPDERMCVGIKRVTNGITVERVDGRLHATVAAEGVATRGEVE